MKILIKSILSKFFFSVTPSLYYRLVYYHNRGHLPNLKNPQDISEIILSNMMNGNIKKMYKYVDKILARQYIAEWIGEEYLPKLYGVWDKFEDINFNSLPDKFALKTNHGCGNHYFCSDKSKLDIEEARKTINKALNNRFHNSPEQQYELIEPKIFCEELIEIEGKEQPEDYKFMCCDGEIKCILICLERKKGLKLAFYDLNWNQLDYARGPEKYYGEVARPKHLEEMIDIAKKIASNFEHIRIDMYDTGTRVYIGELTFTPEGGKLSYMTNEAVRKCGHVQS